MFAVLICILAISCGTWRVQAASDSSSKISLPIKRTVFLLRKGLSRRRADIVIM